MAGEWEYTWIHLAVAADGILANHKYQGDTSTKPNESLDKFLQRLGDERWEMVGVLLSPFLLGRSCSSNAPSSRARPFSSRLAARLGGASRT